MALFPFPTSFSSRSLVLLALTPALSLPVFAQTDLEDEDNLSLFAGARQTWDSNYLRRADGSSEEITVLSAGAKAQKTFSRQTFSASAGVSDYQFAENDSLDGTIYRWGLAWDGAGGNRFGYKLSWGQKQRLPDRNDFTGDDIITLDEKKLGLSLKMNSGWRLLARGRLAENTHSNDGQKPLDYEEQEFGGGIGYVTASKSQIDFYLLSGEREYTNRDGLPSGSQDLDFDFQRATLEMGIRIGGNTSVDGFVAFFNRDGGVNDGSGLETGIESTINLTGKTSVTAGYTLLQPPVGEESNSPDLTNRVSGHLPKLPLPSTSRCRMTQGCACLASAS